MRSIILSALIFIALASTSMAKTEDVSAGPFKVSFDLNTKEDYSIHTESENLQTVNSPNCTEYEVKVVDPLGQPSVTISIFHYEKPWYLDIASFGESIADGFFRSRMGFDDVKLSYRDIDGRDGILISARSASMPQEVNEAYAFAYVIDDRTNVDVISFYDWDDGSQSLVNSINITTVE
jgi:hypothetical protein